MLLCLITRAYLRHGLVDALNPVSHGKLIHYLLRVIIKVDLPRIITLGLWKLDGTALHLTQVVEEVLVQAGVLDMVGRHLLLTLDFYRDMESDGT